MFYKTKSQGHDSSAALLLAGLTATQSATVTSYSRKTTEYSGVLLATMTDKLVNDSGVKVIERAFLDPFS